MNINKYRIRKLAQKDYFNGYLELLEQLTTVNKENITYLDFCRIYDSLYGPSTNVNTHIYVIEDISSGKLVATGTIFIEQKFIHNLGKVGHIEDIVVNKTHRGNKLGKMMINHLISIGKQYKCYKIILDCDKKNVDFYKKCGFEQKGIEMATYISTNLKL